jgi:hypothetical protein
MSNTKAKKIGRQSKKNKSKDGLIDKVSGPCNYSYQSFLKYLVVVAKNMKGAKMYEQVILEFSLFNISQKGQGWMGRSCRRNY